ncbi:hypothetical protein PsYK624_026270 [Phanerochaete sordida]|uniref:F-box domain-containing protein n=1 Tax=Phanerochaete sordida TaxID=48140 RepID=A0A9P3LA97_9APHY|nr:hypothetical protein PsYK624_026270 [Phanerochaete sordida]
MNQDQATTAKHTRLAELSAEQSLLEIQKAELLRQSDLVEASLRRIAVETAEFSPLYTLPIDVLMDILEVAYEHTPHDRRCAIEQNPMIPAQVCRRWRRAALALPRLWSCLHVNCSAELLALWLARSGSLPLRIICAGKDVEARRTGAGMTAAQSAPWTASYLQGLTNLMQHASRWQHFDIETSHSVFLQTVLEVMGGNYFPALEYLAVWHAGHAQNISSRSSLLSCCPRLTELALLRLDAPFSIFTPLRHLSELYLGCRSFTSWQLSQLAKALPELVELTLDQVTEAWSPNGVEHTAVFPSLKTLFFQLTDWEDIFYWMEAPMLETMSCDQGPLWAEPPQRANLSRVFPRLRELRLPRSSPQPDGDGHLFRTMPNLRYLDLGKCHGAFYCVLSCLTRDEDLLPHLEILTLTEGAEEPHGILLQFLDGRRRAERPLKEVRLGRELHALPLWDICGMRRMVKVTCLMEEEDLVSPVEPVEGQTSGVAYW